MKKYALPIALIICLLVIIFTLTIPFIILGGVGRGGDISKGSGEGGGYGCLSLALPNITDQAGFAAAINQYISKFSGSPLAGLGDDFVKAGVQYKVNPAFVVAIAANESTLGEHIPAGSFNSFGRTASADQPHVSLNGRLWYKYDSFSQSLYGQSDYLQRVFLSQGLSDTTSVANKYAPASENDTAEYIVHLNTIIGNIVSLAGNALSCSSGSSSKIVQIAEQQIGLKEDPDGSNKGPAIAKFLGSAASAGEMWCGDFVSWVYREAGSPLSGGDDGGWRIAGSGAFETFFQAKGVWVSQADGQSKPPQPGDIFYTINGGQGHVGIVVSLQGTTVTTIAGNSGNYGHGDNQVGHDVYVNYLTNSIVQGWGRMK